VLLLHARDVDGRRGARVSSAAVEDVDISCGIGIGIGIEMTLTQHSMRTLATSLPAPCSNKLIFDRHFTFTHAIAMELTHSRETAQLLLKEHT
jgi:hypothetical protein